MKARLLKAAVVPSLMESPRAFQDFVAGELDRWGKLVKEKNITAAE